MKRLIKKYQNGNNIVQREQYKQWLKLSPIEKFKRNWRIARSFTNNGANITNLYNAGKAIIGGFNPTNPDLIIGAPEILPGRVPSVKIPKGYTFVKQLDLKTKNGSRIAHMVKDPNGKFKILEDLNLSLNGVVARGKGTLKKLVSGGIVAENLKSDFEEVVYN